MTFARFARVLAIVLVAFALWRMRPPAEPPRVAILALPGTAQDLVFADAVRDGEGAIRLPAGTSGASFWRHLVAAGDGEGTDASPKPPLWTNDPAPVRVEGAPARLFVDRVQQDVDGAYFLGSSAGVVVEAADITAGRLPFPYDRAVDAVAAAVGSLGLDQWSEWIPVPPAPGVSPDAAAPAAEFQLARHTDSTYYLSPAYVAGRSDVVGDAFLRGLDRELRPMIAKHVVGLAERRTPARRALFRAGGDQKPVLVFEDVAEDATRVFAPDSTPAAVVEQVRGVLAGTLDAVRESVGKDGLVLVIGGPPSTRQRGSAAWYRLVHGAGGSGETGPGLDLAAASSLVRYFSGIALDAQDKSRLPADLVASYPVKPTVSQAAAAKADEPPDQQWTASALESVPGAVSGN
jgi:hypothetical protein